ncbi:hypothetical protein ACWFNE_06930 [Cellulomonas sp. NPDC055163]
MKEALIAIPELALDVPQLVAAAQERWPGSSVSQDRLGNVSVAWSRSATEHLELAFHADGRGVGLDGEGPQLAAEAIAWLLRTADIPAEAGAVLVDWAPDFVPLDRTSTPETILAANTKW